MGAPQHVYDAIKKAREEGEAWVTWNGERLRLVPVSDDYGSHFTAIVKSRRAHGSIALAEVDAYKDVGSRVRIYEGDSSRMASWEQVLVVVAERHERPGAARG